MDILYKSTSPGDGGNTDFTHCINENCPYVRNTIKTPEHEYVGTFYCGLELKERLECCPRWREWILEQTHCRCVLIHVDDEVEENNSCG